MRMAESRLIKMTISPLSCFGIYTAAIRFVVLLNVESIIKNNYLI
jgi:hypothetical protein